MKEVIAVIFATIAVSILVGAVAMLFVWPLLSYTCKARWEGNTKVEAIEFGMIEGCRIKVQGDWIPEDRYRTIAE